MHLKRELATKHLPIERKGTTFVVRATSHVEKSVPVLIAVRNMLKLAQQRKEVKQAIHTGAILLNHRKVSDERQSILLFDVLSIVPSKKHYRLEFDEKGRFTLKEISESESKKKIVKIENKTLLKNKKMQLNLSDGTNILRSENASTHDSLVISLPEHKVLETLPLKEGAEVVVIAGKHVGSSGKVGSMDQHRKTITLHTKDKKVEVLIKQIIVI